MNEKAKSYQESILAFVRYPAQVAETYLLLGLSSEVGELHGKVAKALRGDSALDKQAVLLELGDIQFFVAMLATHYGFSLEEIMQANVDKLTSRAERNTIHGDGDNR